jgi:hypothetical protein
MSHYNAFPSEDLEAAADREFGPMVSAMNPHFDVQAFDDAMCIAIASSSFDVMGPETRANNSHSDQAFDTFVDEFPLASAEPGTFALRPQFDPSRRAQTV